MNRDSILNVMKYLGYVVRDESGEITPRAWATATALVGKVIEGITLSPTIATEWAKHCYAGYVCEACHGQATRSIHFDGALRFVCDDCGSVELNERSAV